MVIASSRHDTVESDRSCHDISYSNAHVAHVAQLAHVAHVAHVAHLTRL